MSARVTLSKNLKLLMKQHGLKSLTEVVARNGGSNGALDRMRRAASGASIDAVEQLASAFSIEPWQLLADDLGDDLHAGFDPDTLAFAARYSRMSVAERHRLRLLEQVARDGVTDKEVEDGFRRANEQNGTRAAADDRRSTVAGRRSTDRKPDDGK